MNCGNEVITRFYCIKKSKILILFCKQPYEITVNYSKI